MAAQLLQPYLGWLWAGISPPRLADNRRCSRRSMEYRRAAVPRAVSSVDLRLSSRVHAPLMWPCRACCRCMGVRRGPAAEQAAGLRMSRAPRRSSPRVSSGRASSPAHGSLWWGVRSGALPRLGARGRPPGPPVASAGRASGLPTSPAAPHRADASHPRVVVLK